MHFQCYKLSCRGSKFFTIRWSIFNLYYCPCCTSGACFCFFSNSLDIPFRINVHYLSYVIYDLSCAFYFAVQLFPSDIRCRIFFRCFINGVTLEVSNMNCDLGCCDGCNECLTTEERGVCLFFPKVMSLFSEIFHLVGWGKGEEEELSWSISALTSEQS